MIDVKKGASPPAPLWGLLPVKDFGRAKSRLAPALSNAARAQLARRMCRHVLQTLKGCSALAGILVLSDSEQVLQWAKKYDVCAEPEPALLHAAWPLGAIIDDGLLRLQQKGAQAALVLMSDLPLLDTAEVTQLLSLLGGCDMVIAPDLREQNTNALALRLGGHMPTAFGSGDSFIRHLQKAAQSEMRVAVHRASGLGFDVDLPQDYIELVSHAQWSKLPIDEEAD